MPVHTRKFNVSTGSDTDILDITGLVQKELSAAGLNAGIALVFVPGSTAAVSKIEYESGVVKDLSDAVERIAPQDIPYAHDMKWRDGNGHSHVRSALIGPSFTVPFTDGKLILGTWQQIVLLDFDVRERRRLMHRALGTTCGRRLRLCEREGAQARQTERCDQREFLCFRHSYSPLRLRRRTRRQL